MTGTGWHKNCISYYFTFQNMYYSLQFGKHLLWWFSADYYVTQVPHMYRPIVLRNICAGKLLFSNAAKPLMCDAKFLY